jgi:hypothetical protein
MKWNMDYTHAFSFLFKRFQSKGMDSHNFIILFYLYIYIYIYILNLKHFR